MVSATKKFYSREVQRAMHAIHEWKQEASIERVDHFYKTPVVATILSGTKQFVVGRKGSGKSAIVNYIYAKNEQSFYSSVLNFGDFPFGELFKYADDGYPKGSEYITFWKYTILCAVAKKMAGNDNVSAKAQKAIKKIFFHKGIKSLANDIGYWNQIELGGLFLGTGGTAKLGKGKRSANLTIREKTEILSRFILDNIDHSKYFVLFDALDEGYEEMQKVDSRNKYTSLVVGLFKAINSIRADFLNTNVNIYPVLFIRDDIMRLLNDHNRSKWNDGVIGLYWTEENLKKMICHRIKISGGFHPDIRDNDVWHKVVSKSAIRRRTGRGSSRKYKSTTIFKYILQFSHYRPRDLIVFLQKASEMALANGQYKMTGRHFTDSERGFSDYMMEQLEDEMWGIIPQRRKLIKNLAEFQSRRLTLKQFKQISKKDYCIDNDYCSSPQTLVETMYNFGFIGNPNLRIKHGAKENTVNFKFLTSTKVNIHQPLIIHRGFCSSMGI